MDRSRVLMDAALAPPLEGTAVDHMLGAS